MKETKINLSWLHEDQRLFLKRGYLNDSETPEDRFLTIADSVKKYSMQNAKTWKAQEYLENIDKRFIKYFENNWVSLSTPVLKSFGHKDNLPISCNFSILEDSLDDIYKGLHEVGMLAKYGAGTAVNFSDIRPMGSDIKSGGTSNTILDWIELYADMMSKTAQNSQRRGFLTAYLSVDHPEIMDFLDIGTTAMPQQKQRFFQTITTAVTLPIGWRNDIRTNPEKRKIFSKILNTRKECGFPYILDEENSNKGICQAYVDKGMKIRSSNICVSGDQRVVTDRGLLTARELFENGEVLVLHDNNSIVMSSPMYKIGENVDTYKITLKNGITHTVTEDHKLKIKKGRDWENKSVSDISLGDKVYVQTAKGLFGVKDAEDEAFILGMFQGDGSKTGSSIQISVWEQDKDLIPVIEDIHEKLQNKYKYLRRFKDKGTKFVEADVKQNLKVKKYNLNSVFYDKVLNFEKTTVPYWIWEGTESTQWNYLKGLFYTDGTVTLGKKTEKLKNKVLYLSLTNTNKEFLQDIQLICLNLGLNANIYDGEKEGLRNLPDGKGGKRDYYCNATYRIVISNLNDALTFEKNTGFLTRKGVTIEDRKYRDNTKKSHEVISIEYVGKQDVFCTTVASENHHWICNGVVTHNCIEAIEYANYEKTFACCLSAVNLYWWDDFKDDPNFLFDMYILLDCVIEEYIQKGSKMPGMEKAVLFAKEHRAVGLGTTGLHSYLQKNMIEFGSVQSFGINNQIFSKLREEGERASSWMAEYFGEPEMLKGYGKRCTSLMAQAPKKSTTFIDGGTHLGLSEGIEPHKSNYNEKKLAKIQVEFKNKELEKLLTSKGKNTPDVWESILNNNGSVQHLEWLTDHEKNVFKTFSEISQVDIINLASARQKYIDMGQSINLMIHPDTPAKEIINLHLEAFEKGLKSLYYQYSINASQTFNQKLMTCSSCEG